MYDQAVDVVLKTRRASISLVQRHLRIGYNRAARLIEDMERAGLVSSMNGAGNREVLAPAPSSGTEATAKLAGMKIPALLTFTLFAVFATTAQAGAVDQLKSFVESTKSARADFSQSVSGKSGRKPQLSSGKMMFARPGKFRWVYEKPYPQVLVGDGRKLWVYDPDLKQVSVNTIGKALGSSPAALLAGEARWRRTSISLKAAATTG